MRGAKGAELERVRRKRLPEPESLLVVVAGQDEGGMNAAGGGPFKHSQTGGLTLGCQNHVQDAGGFKLSSEV